MPTAATPAQAAALATLSRDWRTLPGSVGGALLRHGLVERTDRWGSVGRPVYVYRLTLKGVRALNAARQEGA